MLLGLLKVNKCHVFHIKELFKETGNVCDWLRATGPPRSVHMKNVVNVVHTQITWNPCCKQNLPRDEFITQNRFVCSHRRFPQTYKRYTRHLLDTPLRCLWLERLKKLLRVYGKNLFKKISFTDEKIFTIEEKFNKQNDKVYAWTLYKAKSKVPRI